VISRLVISHLQRNEVAKGILATCKTVGKLGLKRHFRFFITLK